jgi:hypothetical protein
LFALVDLGRKDPAAMKMAEDIITAFMSEPKSPDQELAGDFLKEYARQARAYIKNEKVTPVEVKPMIPTFLVEELKKK